MTEPVWGSPGVALDGPMMRVIGYLSDILELLTNDDSLSPDDESPGLLGCPLPPFCRVAIYPGLEVPWDSCGVGGCGEADGQLYAALQPLTRVPTSDAGNGSCQTYQWTALVAAVRCAAKLGDDGQPPSVDAVQQDAIRQARDADGIRYAIQCCPGRSQRMKDAGIVLDSWAPLGPQTCVGGAWTIRGRFDVCC